MTDNSRQRIVEFGEVFTSIREVNSMLDLVSNETSRIESRFLEPACGNGNFLFEVLSRKLTVVSQLYKASQHEYEKYVFLATSSVYGIEILKDNVELCRRRLFSLIEEKYLSLFPVSNRDDFLNSVKFLLSRNIIWGDALTLMLPDGSGPITFSEWGLFSGNLVKRKDFTLNTLLAYQPMEGETLFSDLGEEAFMPTPIKEYDAIHFLEVSDV